MDELVKGAHVEQESSQRTLNLGVVVQPYTFLFAQQGGIRTTKAMRARKGSAITTADVAHILEDKYGLFDAFYRVKQNEITGEIAESLKGAMEAMIMGAPAIDPFGEATSSIEAKFRDFINSGEAERSGIPGTPTKAAQRGVNHRLAHPYRRSNSPRPSFRDTGLLTASFKSWVD